MLRSERRTARPRLPVDGWVLKSLGWLYRYSEAREAYVLKPFGGRIGPVLVRK